MDTTGLAYTESGTGPAVVLLHAFPLNASIWESLQHHLSADYRVISVDLPGFGRSQPPRPFTMDSAADELHALLGHLGAVPCALVGLSMGGYVAFAFADRHPDALAKLVVIDSKAAGDDPAGKAARNAMIDAVRRGGASAVAQQMLPRLLAEQTREQQPALVQRLTEIIHSTLPLTIEYGLSAMRDRPDRTAALAKIAVPTLIVVGEHDKLAPPEVAAELQRQIPGAQLVVLRGAGHVSAIEQPADFLHLVRSFLQRPG